VDVAAKENPGQRFLIVALLQAPDQRRLRVPKTRPVFHVPAFHGSRFGQRD
jgi:hypothetical protein